MGAVVVNAFFFLVGARCPLGVDDDLSSGLLDFLAAILAAAETLIAFHRDSQRAQNITLHFWAEGVFLRRCFPPFDKSLIVITRWGSLDFAHANTQRKNDERVCHS